MTTENQLRDELRRTSDALEKAREKLVEQDELLQRLAQPPFSYSTVVDQGKDAAGKAYLVTANGGQYTRVAPPKNVNVNPGDMVVVSPMTGQIIEIEPLTFAGSVSIIKAVLDEKFSEIDASDGGSGKLAFNGRVNHKDLEPGDRVVVDASGSVIIRKMPKTKNQYVRDNATPITWDSIGGLAEAKSQMIEAVELPRSNPEIFKRYNKAPPKGILLYGPPGCGKTMLGKAAATSLAHQSGEGGGFMYVKAPEILDRFVGVAEGNVRAIFNAAKAYKQRTGQQAVVFIDEADAVLGRRGANISSDINMTVVPSFLTEMDGLDDSGALVILATNRPDTLDPAIVRDGRIDRKIKVTRPDQGATADIVRMNLHAVPLAKEENRDGVSQEIAETIFCPSRVLYHLRTTKGERDLTLSGVVNGAMVAGIVEKATSKAMRRDLAQDNKKGGVTRNDMLEAVDDVLHAARDLDVSGDLRDLLSDDDADVLAITRPRLVAAE
jgi:proteasome-associated ATPase